MLILEDLYLGDVRPSERSFKRNTQYAKALDELVKAGDALTDTLSEKQKEIFEDYMTAQREVNVITDGSNAGVECVFPIIHRAGGEIGAKTPLDVIEHGGKEESPDKAGEQCGSDVDAKPSLSDLFM